MLLFANVATPEAHYTSIGSASGITLDSHFERAPTSTYAIGETYDYDLSANSKRRATLNWSWEASQHSTPTDSDTLVLPSYGLLNGRLEYPPSPTGRSRQSAPISRTRCITLVVAIIP